MRRRGARRRHSRIFTHDRPFPALPGWVTERPFAHRGLHGEGIPENTLAAFEAAIAASYPIELDVQILGDGELVVFHDDDLIRAAGVARSLRQESRDTIGRHPLFGSDQRIPTLDDTLAFVAGRVPLLVEIKNRPTHRGIEQAAAAKLARYRGRVALQSFHPHTVAWFRRHVPELPCGQLAGPLRHDRISLLEQLASRRLLVVAWSRPDFINYDLRALPDAWVSLVARGFAAPLLCWTVRSESDRAKAETLGINYVFDHVRP